LPAAKFDGAAMSSNCRMAKSAIAALDCDNPRTPDAAECHHCSVSRKVCAIKLKGGRSQS
jgi:hypothetical protein